MFTLSLIKQNLFSFPNVMPQHAISRYFLSRVNKLKENYSLKRKKQPVRVTCENSRMLKEAATTSYS